MEIILLEKYRKLGNVGDLVEVKGGFARNYLIPQKKALRATKANKEMFEAKKSDIQKEFDQKIVAANQIKEALQGKHIVIIKQASEDERLYGSTNSAEIVSAIKEQLSQELSRSTVDMSTQVKYLGVYDILIHLFADVSSTVKLVVARSKEEGDKFIAELKASEKSKKKEKEAAEVETIAEESYQQE